MGPPVRPRQRPEEHRLRAHAGAGRRRSAPRAPTPSPATTTPCGPAPRSSSPTIEPAGLDRVVDTPLGPAGHPRRAPGVDRRRLHPARRPGRLRARAARARVTPRAGRGDPVALVATPADGMVARRPRPDRAPGRVDAADVRPHRGDDRAPLGVVVGAVGRRGARRASASPAPSTSPPCTACCHGGWRADPALVWAGAHDLDPETVPPARRPTCSTRARRPPSWPSRSDPTATCARSGRPASGRRRPSALAPWAALALDVADRPAGAARRHSPPTTPRRWRRRGPSRRPSCCAPSWPRRPARRPPARPSGIIAAIVGPRPRSDAEAAAQRARTRRRGAAPRARRAPSPTCATRPRCGRCCGASASRCPTPGPGGWSRSATPTRSSRRCWRGARLERTATTYGYGWLDEHVGADGRLRGQWTGVRRRGRADDGDGRPAQPAGRPAPGRRRRARPRLRARRPRPDRAARPRRGVRRRAPSPRATRDRRPLRAGRRPQLGVDRPTAKVAVLGRHVRPDHRPRRPGAAPARGRVPGGHGATSHDADVAGQVGRDLRTYGGRLDPHRHDQRQRRRPSATPGAARRRSAATPATRWSRARRPSCSRCGRSPCGPALGAPASIVLCLHDELLVHVPAADGDDVGPGSSTTACRRRPAAGRPTTPCASSPTPPSSTAGPTPSRDRSAASCDDPGHAHRQRRDRAARRRRRPGGRSTRRSCCTASAGRRRRTTSSCPSCPATACCRLDFRGHGQSDRAPGHYLLDGFASDAEAVLDQVVGGPAVDRRPLARRVTAAYVAQRRPDLVTALFLGGPAAVLRQGDVRVDRLRRRVPADAGGDRRLAGGRRDAPSRSPPAMAAVPSMSGQGTMGDENMPDAMAVDRVRPPPARPDRVRPGARRHVARLATTRPCRIPAPGVLLQPDRELGAAFFDDHAARLAASSAADRRRRGARRRPPDPRLAHPPRPSTSAELAPLPRPVGAGMIVDPHHHLWVHPDEAVHGAGAARRHGDRPRRREDGVRRVRLRLPHRRARGVPPGRRDRVRRRRRPRRLRRRHRRLRRPDARPRSPTSSPPTSRPGRAASAASATPAPGTPARTSASRTPSRRPACSASDDFRRGFAALGAAGLSFDAWLFHPQLPELVDLCRAVPDVPVILDHLGGPLGIGPYAGRRDEVLAEWRAVDGRGRRVRQRRAQARRHRHGDLRDAAGTSERRGVPSSSSSRRGASRSAGASRRSAPSAACSSRTSPSTRCRARYADLWAAFELIAADASPADRDDLFAGTATRAYRL